MNCNGLTLFLPMSFSLPSENVRKTKRSGFKQPLLGSFTDKFLLALGANKSESVDEELRLSIPWTVFTSLIVPEL